MVGERTGRIFRLGQKLQVNVVRVNLEERKIDFELADNSPAKLMDKGNKPGKKVKVSARAAELASEHEKKRKSRGKSAAKKKTAKGKTASKRGKAGAKKKRPTGR